MASHGQENTRRSGISMTIQTIHLEVIESMSALCFINCLLHFFAIRGPPKILYDCGTNFVRACKELQTDKQACHNTNIQAYLLDNKCCWQFNPPHASHMAGSWECMTGVARRILDAMLLQHSPARLTHEVLVTFMAEVSAIVNARLLTAVSMDPEQPMILTPAMLLTQKFGASPVSRCWRHHTPGPIVRKRCS
ncbi:hypothetical protein QQF64_012070 [Cirrhinus molitorella]|uniref:Uncharacterized protein n=1 Tax=Cirrhinus molitorella TaxID=172907 RepID=A0ABR3LW19_9TELE